MFDKSKIGQSFPPFIFEVARGKIRELALAIGDDNPIYQSQEEAQAASYPDVPLSPTAPTMFLWWGNTGVIAQLATLGIDLTRILHGQEEYEYLAPIYPGDTLTGVMKLMDGKSRKGQDGSMTNILMLEIAYANQQGQPVLKARQMIVARG